MVSAGRDGARTAFGRFTLRRRAYLWALLLGVLVVPSTILALRSIALVMRGAPAVDFQIFEEAAERVTSGGLYLVEADYAFRYSPVAAYLLGPLAGLGTTLWRLLHVVAAAALPSRLAAVIVLLSGAFWFDVSHGNLLTFILLAGVWALYGSRIGTGTFLASVLLMPRPLVIPLAVWLLWKRPEWRLPFAGMFVVHAVAVLATGWADEWIPALVASGSETESIFNFGPTRIVGFWWFVVGVPLAVWLTVRGRVGLAGISISPYLLPYYWLFALPQLNEGKVELLRSRPSMTSPRRPRTGDSRVPSAGWRLAGSWTLPIAGSLALILVIDRLLPAADGRAFFMAAFAFLWLPMAALWALNGRTLISIGMWLAPAVTLSLAWVLGAGLAIDLGLLGVNIGVLVISFFPRAITWWDVLVSRAGTFLVRLSLNAGDRSVDLAAERVRRRVWAAAQESRRSGSSRFSSDLLGIRMAADDLPTDDVGAAQLRRALVQLIDALYQRVNATPNSAPSEPDEALEGYWRALHRYRSRSLLYRVMTLRRGTA